MTLTSVTARRYGQLTRSAVPRRAYATDQMSPSLDELSLQFAIWTRNSKGAALDIGCGDGIATLAALSRGGRVRAIDPSETALQNLLAHTPPEYSQRLDVQVGALPNIEFKSAHFSAVHAARVLHTLDPPTVEASLQKFFRWLYPAGKLFVSALAPAGPFWKRLRPEYGRRNMSRERWPGYFDDVSQLMPVGTRGPLSVHLLDERTLQRELESAGFELEHSTCYALPWDPGQMCSAVIARCSR